MGHWLRELFCVVCFLQISQCLDVDEQGFIQALIDSYDNNVSFPENFYTLLGLICPSSVYCQNDNSSDSEIDNIGLWGTDIFPDVANFSASVSNIQTGVNADARTILKLNSRKVKGCCVPCSCEMECVERQNCCPTMLESLREMHDVQRKTQITQECVRASITSYLQTVKFLQLSTGSSYFMVTNCFSANANEDIAMKCRQPNPKQEKETKPVYSASTGRIYKNKYCAICNDDIEVTPWISEIVIDNRVSFTGPFALPTTPEELYLHVIRSPKMYSIVFLPPDNMLPEITNFECTIPESELISIDKCSSNNNFFFRQTCKYRQHLFYTGKRKFANVFCSICQQTFYGPKECLSGSYRDTDTSFSALLIGKQFNQVYPSDVINLDTGSCSCTEYFDKRKKHCRQLVCAPGELFVDCACRAFLQDIEHMPVKIFIEIVPERSHIGGQAEQLLLNKPDENVIKAIVNKIKKTVSNFGALKIVRSTLFRVITGSKMVSFKFFNFISVTFPNISDDKKAITRVFNALHVGISVPILGAPMNIILGRVLNSTDVSRAISNQLLNSSDNSEVVLERVWPDDRVNFRDEKYAAVLSKLLYCLRVRLESSEVELLQTNPKAVGLTQPYLSYVFWEEDKSMCLEDFEAAFIPNSSGKLRATNDVSVLYVIWLILTVYTISRLFYFSLQNIVLKTKY